MRVRKAIWIPLALGSMLSLLSLVSMAVEFLIRLGLSGGVTGPKEIPLMILAAIGGPLGLFVASLFHQIGVYLFLLNPEFSPEQMSSAGELFAGADFRAHILALLAAAYAYRFLHQRARKVYTYLAGWIFIVVIYYTLLVFSQSFLVGFVVPITPPFSTLFQDFLPEFQVTVIITTLILLALPARFRKPQWYESNRSLNRNDRVPDELKASAP